MKTSTGYASDRLKQKRIDLRTTAKIKDILMYAAESIGMSISAFMTAAAYEKAKKIISAQEMVILSAEERNHFLSVLEKPTKLNSALKAAMRDYLDQK